MYNAWAEDARLSGIGSDAMSNSNPTLQTTRQRENVVASILCRHGCMTSEPQSGNPKSDRFNDWGVYVGSHGGHGPTLIIAMRNCLDCCGIGEWCRADYGEGEMLANLFGRLCEQYGLGEITEPPEGWGANDDSDDTLGTEG